MVTYPEHPRKPTYEPHPEGVPLIRRSPTRRTFLAGLGSTAAAVMIPAFRAPGAAQAAGTQTSSNDALAAAAASMPKPLLGGATQDRAWYAANIGPTHIRRCYDTAFVFPTWQQTSAFKRYGTVPMDYSFQLPPGDLASGAADAKLRTFLATTPKDLILTNYHEPEPCVSAGQFSAAQFRAAIAHLTTLVRAQNARDGGKRRVSVILEYATVFGFAGRNPLDYWPGRDANGVNRAHLISFDTYAWPHSTNTQGVPVGFTDGVKWQSAAELLDPSIAFAKQIGSPWMVSEFGFLEDIHDSTHKAKAITDFVNYARLHGAVTVEYWDAVGRRADWQLRHGAKAVTAWKSIVNAP
jgi:hypothetical protein